MKRVKTKREDTKGDKTSSKREKKARRDYATEALILHDASHLFVFVFFFAGIGLYGVL